MNDHAIKVSTLARVRAAHRRGELGSLLLTALINRCAKLSNASWAKYHARQRFYKATEAQELFSQRRYLFGNLGENITNGIKAIFVEGRGRTFNSKDYAFGYRANYSVRNNDLDGYKFYEIDDSARAAIEHAVARIADELDSVFDSPWRITNVRAWTIDPVTADRAANSWHSDGFNPAVLKVMIYPDPVGELCGTTEICSIRGDVFQLSGDAGTYLIFDSTTLRHRGVPPKNGTRKIVELTIVPSPATDYHPVSAGMNAHYPWLPSKFLGQLSKLLRSKRFG